MMSRDQVLIQVLTGRRVQILAFIWSIVREPQLVEDVYQEVCLVAMEKRPQIDNEAELMRWLRAVAKNKSRQALERRQKNPRLMEPDLLDLIEEQWKEGDESSPATELKHLEACLNRLTPNSRKIVDLRYGEGLATRKVAEALQRNVEALYKALTRIHKELEECVRRRLRAEGGSARA